MTTQNERALAALKNWKSWKEDDYLSFLEKHYYAVEKALQQNEKLVGALKSIVVRGTFGTTSYKIAQQALAEYEKGEK